MNKTVHYLFALWIVLAGSIGSPQPCFADDVVTLRGETEVRRMTVKLSDVFAGIPESTDTEIAQAPAPGKQMVYDINVLTRLANKYHLDWKPHSLADHATIKTACTHISIDAIREAIVRKLKTDGSNIAQKNSEIDVTMDNHALEVDLPADQAPDFTFNNFDYDATSKRFHADLFASTSSGSFTIPIAGHIVIKRNIPVLAKRLEGGTVIGSADIDWIPVAEERINGAVVTDARQLIDHELRRDVEEGEIIHSHDIIPQRLVTRGSIVTMKIETPLMQVTAQGKALQDGTQGDIVRLINTQSNRMIEGTVTGPGTVLVHTTQKVAEAQ